MLKYNVRGENIEVTEEIKDLELVSYLDVLVDGEFIYEQFDAKLK